MIIKLKISFWLKPSSTSKKLVTWCESTVIAWPSFEVKDCLIECRATLAQSNLLLFFFFLKTTVESNFWHLKALSWQVIVWCQLKRLPCFPSAVPRQMTAITLTFFHVLYLMDCIMRIVSLLRYCTRFNGIGI